MSDSTHPVPAEATPLAFGCKLVETIALAPDSVLRTVTETNRPSADTDEDADDE
jgi:hypothetical protein